MVSSAPTAVVFTVLGLVMLLYALPIAMINAELAVAIPEDGGLVVWVQEALGARIGGHNSWLVWNSYIFDASIYPVLAAQYLVGAIWHKESAGDKTIHVMLIAEAVVIFVTCLKLMGNDILVKFAMTSGVVSLSPAFVFIGWGLVSPHIHLDPAAWWRTDWVWNSTHSVHDHSGSSDAGVWTEPASLATSLATGLDWTAAAVGGESLVTDAGSHGGGTGTAAAGADDCTHPGCPIQWELLISWMLWINSGYLGLGSLAAGVDNPKRTFPLIVATLIPFVAFVIVAPFLVALSVDDNIDNYKAGYFSDLAEKIAGPWLRYCFLGGSLICLVGLYANTVITSEVSMQYFVEDRFPSLTEYDSGGALRRWLLIHDDAGAAKVYILFNGFVAMVLVLLPYKVLIEFTMTLMALPTLLFLISFVKLRIDRPSMQRDFKIPGNTFVAGLIVFPPFAITCYQAYLTLKSDPKTGADALRVDNDLVPYPATLALALVLGTRYVPTVKSTPWLSYS